MVSPPPAKRQKTEAEAEVDWTSLPAEVWLAILRLVTTSTLASVARTCRSLRGLCEDPSLWTRLSLDWQTIKKRTASCEQLVSRCPKLTHLTITNRTFERVKHSLVASLVLRARDSLTHLVISQETAMKSEAVSSLGKLTNLTSLELAGDWIHGPAAVKLANLTNLTQLKIPGSGKLVAKDLKDLFSQLTKLTLVDVSECKKGITNSSVTALATNNPNLEYLAIDECEMVTGHGVKAVAEWCPKLQHLSMDGCYQVNDVATLKVASSCPDLRYLSLGLCSTVKDSTLNKLGPGCPHLEFLNLFGCAYLSEKGIERLVTTAPALKYLDMRGILGVGQAFSLQLEKDYPNINIVHQFQPKPPRERKRRSRN